MDLQKVTDVNELKALAFDQINARDIASANLQAIVARLNELQSEPSDKGTPEKK